MYSLDFIQKFYSSHIDMGMGSVCGDELRAPCPYHDDKDPSFSVNLPTGMYKCFVQGCKLFNGGNIYQFASIIEQVSVSDAKAKIDKLYNKEKPTKETPPKEKKSGSTKRFPYTQDDIDQRVQTILSNPTMVDFIAHNFLWTIDTIKRFEIGYDTRTQRYWIPVKENNKILNIRRYSPSEEPKLLSITGFGKTVLYPADNLQGNEIYVVEGEKDCILANQLGLNAVTMTCGAGSSFKSEWKPHFIDKAVVVCFDIDDAGKEGAQKVVRTLINVARSIKVIDLPITEPKNGDFTDYIRSGHTIQDFMALVDKAPALEAKPDGPVVIPDDIHETSLDQIDSKKLFYRRSKVNVRVIGTESSPFILPSKITIHCNKESGKHCETCRVGDKNGKDTLMIDETTPALLNLIECGTRDRSVIIRDLFHIPYCKKFTVEEEDHQAINRVSVIPAIDDIQFDQETHNQKYVERELYFMGDNLESNTDYEIEVLTIPSPKDQSMVHVGYSVKYSDSSVEEFQLTPELQEQLEAFNVNRE